MIWGVVELRHGIEKGLGGEHAANSVGLRKGGLADGRPQKFKVALHAERAIWGKEQLTGMLLDVLDRHPRRQVINQDSVVQEEGGQV